MSQQEHRSGGVLDQRLVDVAIVDHRVVFIPDWLSSDSTLAHRNAIAPS